MAAPFIVIRTFRIKKGQLEAFKQFLPEFFKTIESNEPRVLALNAYVNQEGTEAAFVHVYPDAAAMEFHESLSRR
jgi:quinol monooxygenase YgiN